MTIQGKTFRLLAVLASAVLATAAAADGLEKLPPDYTLPQSEGSPGKVIFSHSSHVDVKAPGCTRCHPKLFKTLEKGATADGQRITPQGHGGWRPVRSLPREGRLQLRELRPLSPVVSWPRRSTC